MKEDNAVAIMCNLKEFLLIDKVIDYSLLNNKTLGKFTGMANVVLLGYNELNK